MKVLIFGASGATGRHLVKLALEQDFDVTAFVRDSSKLPISHARLRFIQGDVKDANAVDQAIRGQDIVISGLGANKPYKYDPVVVEGMANIIRSMEANGVRRLIYLSTVAAGEGRRDAGFLIRFIAPKLLRTEIAGHQQREHMIRNSHLNWTIVQAPMLTNGPPQKNYRTGEQLSSGGFANALSRADVADFMIGQIRDSNFSCKTARIMR